MLALLGKLDSRQKETFGFQWNKIPPAVDDLLAFETDLLTTINNTGLKEVHNKFYQNLMMS